MHTLHTRDEFEHVWAASACLSKDDHSIPAPGANVAAMVGRKGTYGRVAGFKQYSRMSQAAGVFSNIGVQAGGRRVRHKWMERCWDCIVIRLWLIVA